MPIVTDYSAVKEVYQDATERGVGLPCFCAEDRETLEAILAAALKTAEAIGVPDLPILAAWTSRYPARAQMTVLTACGEAVLGTELVLSDLAAFMGPTSPYHRLRVLPHLDHAFPWLDGDILNNFTDRFASVMCDASEKQLAENIRITAEYADRMRGRVVIEGAVDEIFESGGDDQKNEPTTVAQAEEFLRNTGVDIIVPNVGTEHRATAEQIVYRSDRAREISAAVGKILCLHGTSSVKPEDLPKLPRDGFVKINIYTTLAVHGGKAVGRAVLDNLGNVFSGDELRELVQGGVLGAAVLAEGFGNTDGEIKPKLAHVVNAPRRDAWFQAVRDRCCTFLEALNYQAFQ